MKYDYDTNIDDDTVETEEIEELLLIAFFDLDDLVSLREKYGNNERGYRNSLVEYIAVSALELGFDDDVLRYNSLYLFFMGSQMNAEREAETDEFIDGMMYMGYQLEIKQNGIPQAPKYFRSPLRYIDTFKNLRENVDNIKHFLRS